MGILFLPRHLLKVWESSFPTGIPWEIPEVQISKTGIFFPQFFPNFPDFFTLKFSGFGCPNPAWNSGSVPAPGLENPQVFPAQKLGILSQKFGNFTPKFGNFIPKIWEFDPKNFQATAEFSLKFQNIPKYSGVRREKKNKNWIFWLRFWGFSAFSQ